jgi:D-alanyl-D-alanine carboxypeptidase/D-alanyl-D-alanine-endopeptidase (penicillin-binding protein 4)
MPETFYPRVPLLGLPPTAIPLRGTPRTPALQARFALHCLLAALCASFIWVTASPSTANASGSLAGLQSDLTQQLSLAGSASGAYVYDLTAKQALFSERATARRPPASVEKIYTAVAALERLGPTARLSTTVLGSGHLAAGGVWAGNLYLRGGGDPTFGSTAFIARHYGGVGASVSSLVSQLVRTDGIHRVTGSIEGDESFFDSLRGEPSTGYAPDPFLEGTLSGLAFNRGATGKERGAHAPAAYAAHELASALKNDGVIIHGSSGAAVTPAGATRLATVQSPTVGQLLGLTLPPSDNFFAETLLKDIGVGLGGAGTTAAGASVVSQTLSSVLGIHPHVVDGSGLSPADKTSPYEIVDLLAGLAPTTLGQAPTSVGSVLRADLAVAGETGTLSKRMRNTGAQGRCQGKTGTLTGASNLVGYCNSADGHLLAFAIFNDGIRTQTAHVFQDHMTITIANY